MTEKNFSVLKEAKQTRQELGGSYLLEEQRFVVPEEFMEGLSFQYGYEIDLLQQDLQIP